MMLETLKKAKRLIPSLSVVLLLLWAECVSIDTFGGSCPCGDGWECCESENICVEQASSCPGNVDSVEGNIIVCQKTDVC